MRAPDGRSSGRRDCRHGRMGARHALLARQRHRNDEPRDSGGGPQPAAGRSPRDPKRAPTGVGASLGPQRSAMVAAWTVFLTSRTRRVAIITLDDGKANVMSVPFFVRLMDALDRAERDNARAVVFAGRPGMFSGGLDLKLLPTLSAPELATLAREFARTLLRVFTFPSPTVAAITGHAIAGGSILAFACDKRFAADGPFRIQVNEVAIGIPVPSWMLLIAENAVPRRYHTEAILHARAYSPSDALERGLLDAVCAAGEDVRSAALDAARALTTLAPTAYAETKRRMRAADVVRALELLEDEAPG